MGAPETPGGARQSTPRDALIPGTRLGDFEILRTLGGGGFGTVYLALDCVLDREVAIKEYMPSQLAYRAHGLEVAVRSSEYAASFEAGLRSFVNEARLLAHFNHHGIVKVHRFWEANGTAYMAMPYVHGPTLRDVRRSMKAPPTEAWFRTVLDPLLDALEMLHAEGIYHRDIAPDNILLPRTGEPVLLDFGAARRVIGDCTQTFTAVLKPSYAPIEQYAEATQLKQGPWTDLYALGAVIVYMLRATPPPPATVRSLHDELPVLLNDPPPGVSANFIAAVHWALAVRPQDRPQSVQQFRNALDGRVVPPPIVTVPIPDLLDEPVGESSPSSPVTGGIVHEATMASRASPPASYSLHPDKPAFERPEAATWDTTIRLSDPARPMVSPQSVRAAVGRWTRMPQAPALAVAASLVFVSAVLMVWWTNRLPDPGPAVWRELGQQQGVASLDETPMSPEPAPKALPVPVGTVTTVAADKPGVIEPADGAPAEPLPTVRISPVKAVPPMIDKLADEAIFERSEVARADKPKAAVKKRSTRPKAAPKQQLVASKAADPREACGDRNFISKAICVNRRCDEPRFRQHAHCVELHRQYEERRRAVPYR